MKITNEIKQVFDGFVKEGLIESYEAEGENAVIVNLSHENTLKMDNEFLLHIIEAEGVDVATEVLRDLLGESMLAFNFGDEGDLFEFVKDSIILIPQAIPENYHNSYLPASRIIEPLVSAGLTSVYAINKPNSLHFVVKPQFEKWGVTEEELYEVAKNNLKRLISFEEVNVSPVGKEEALVYLASCDDMDLVSSAIFIMDDIVQNSDVVISMPKRSFFSYGEPSDAIVGMLVIMTQDMYDKEPRYKKISAPIVRIDGLWSFAYIEAENQN